MTGEQYVAQCKSWLETTCTREDISLEEADAIRFVLMNWYKFEPTPISAWAEQKRLRDLANTVYNYLGMRDPGDVGRWISDARAAVADFNAKAVG